LRSEREARSVCVSIPPSVIIRVIRGLSGIGFVDHETHERHEIGGGETLSREGSNGSKWKRARS
jgi:hypothetical protein